MWLARRSSAALSNEGAVMLFACIMGTFGYLIAGIALTASSIGSFDRLAGRTGMRWSPSLQFEPPAKPFAEPPKESAADAILLRPKNPFLDDLIVDVVRR